MADYAGMTSMHDTRRWAALRCAKEGTAQAAQHSLALHLIDQEGVHLLLRYWNFDLNHASYSQRWAITRNLPAFCSDAQRE